MRTTLDIEDDVLQAAKELARRERSTAGRVISALARRGLTGAVSNESSSSRFRSGVPLLPSRGEVATLEHVLNLVDKEGV